MASKARHAPQKLPVTSLDQWACIIAQPAVPAVLLLHLAMTAAAGVKAAALASCMPSSSASILLAVSNAQQTRNLGQPERISVACSP